MATYERLSTSLRSELNARSEQIERLERLVSRLKREARDRETKNLELRRALECAQPEICAYRRLERDGRADAERIEEYAEHLQGAIEHGFDRTDLAHFNNVKDSADKVLEHAKTLAARKIDFKTPHTADDTDGPVFNCECRHCRDLWKKKQMAYNRIRKPGYKVEWEELATDDSD